MCGVLISILKYPRQVTQTKGKVKTFLFCFSFLGQERKEGVQALDIRESPLSAPSPPPSSINSRLSTSSVSFSPVLLLVSVKRLWFREDCASQSARDKKRSIIAYIQTACLLALLAAYPAACLQLRDKAMKVSDTRGFGCRTWRLSQSCKTSSPDVMSVVGDINMFIQPLLILYMLLFVLLGSEPSAIITAYYAISTGAGGKLRGRQNSCAGAGEERAERLIARNMQLCALSCAALKR